MAWVINGNLHIHSYCGTFGTLIFYMELFMNESILCWLIKYSQFLQLYLVDERLSVYKMEYSSLTLRSL